VLKIASDAVYFPVAETRRLGSLAAVHFLGKIGRTRCLSPRFRLGERTLSGRRKPPSALVVGVSHTHHIGAELHRMQGTEVA